MPKKRILKHNLYESMAIAIAGYTLDNFIRSSDLRLNPNRDLIFHTFLILLPTFNRMYNDKNKTPYLYATEDMLFYSLAPLAYDFFIYWNDKTWQNVAPLFVLTTAIYLITNLVLKACNCFRGASHQKRNIGTVAEPAADGAAHALSAATNPAVSAAISSAGSLPLSAIAPLVMPPPVIAAPIVAAAAPVPPGSSLSRVQALVEVPAHISTRGGGALAGSSSSAAASLTRAQIMAKLTAPFPVKSKLSIHNCREVEGGWIIIDSPKAPHGRR